MNPYFVKLLYMLLTSKLLKTLSIAAAAALARKTDNTFDDELVAAWKEAVDIRFQDSAATMRADLDRIDDGNIFLPNKELNRIKSKRKGPPK